MQFRSHITRTNCATIARLTSIALAAFLIAGCQSNSDRDLIAREHRLQEDQMWAMQDYIQQYQQLVCRFRSENASLRRQLNEERSSGNTVIEQQPVQRTPVIPPRNIQQQPVAPPNVDMPDVPPLNQGTSNNRRGQNSSLGRNGNRARRDRFVQLTSYEAAINRRAPSSSRNQPADDASPLAAPSDVVVSGTVVANESGGGPRLMIEVQPLDQSGNIIPADGTLSLALLRSDNGVQHRIARWDFGPNELRSAVETTDHGPAIRFRVELPADVKINGPTELWAKLAPSNGGATFCHANVDLANPSDFSSRTDQIPTPRETVVAASYEDNSERSPENSAGPDETPVAINESTWSTAKPGRPATLPPETTLATGGWKASSESMPANAVATSSPIATRIERPKGIESVPMQSQPIETAKKPSWTPDRPGKPSQAPRPTWSATR